MKSLQTRATGASCKECRRLKIKCDKQVPCGTCTKRGLQSLCPDGQLSGTKGSRYVLASAEESWHRIQALCVRVQDLEFALERSHSLIAHDKHPLLDNELLKIGQDPRAVRPESSASPPKPAEDVPISNFGTMKITKAGSYRWLGSTAPPVMMLDDYDQDHIYKLAGTKDPSLGMTEYPDATPMSELKSAAIRMLPPRQEALKIIDTYFDFCWRWPLVVSRAIVMDTLFTPAYDGDASTLSAYNLSSLYSILALGTLFDINMEPNCQEYKMFRHWASKLFYLPWPKTPTAVDELEALVLLFRVSWAFTDNFYVQKYELISWGVKLCEKLGMHRDPAHLNLSTEECVRRRRVFWAMWYHDSMTSLLLGLPPTLAKGFVDCRSAQGTTEASDDIHTHMTLATQDILSHFLESGQPTSYQTVLRIDAKIRQIDVDSCVSYLQSTVLANGSQSTSPNYPTLPHVSELMKGYVRGLKHILLMTLHKTYFSYAVVRREEDPLGPKWTPSTNAMYESSTAALECAHGITRNMPALQARVSPNWPHYHSAVLVLYGFCIYLPYAPHAAEAMKTADAAVAGIFQVHVGDVQQAAASLPSLLRAQAQAKASMAQFQAGTWVHPSESPITPTSILKDGEMTTEMFFNEKLNIAGTFSRHVVQTSHDFDVGSRGSTPSEAMAPGMQGGEAHSIYGGGDGTSSSRSSIFRGNTRWVGVDSPLIVPESSLMEDGAYWIQSPHLQVQEGHHFEEVNVYRQPPAINMDWTTSPGLAHMKVESPPHSALVYSPPYSHTVQVGTGLHAPDEYASHSSIGQTGTIRRVRGLSRARSFPSDFPHGHPGMGSMVVIPPVPHHQLYQPMQAPGQFLPSVSAHVDPSMHASPVRANLSPQGHGPHSQSPTVMYGHPEEERYGQWIGGTSSYRPQPSQGYNPVP